MTAVAAGSSLSDPPVDPGAAPVLRAAGLVCIRGERLVFDGLDLDLPVGGAIRLIGPNGAGKSSLLRMLAGLLPPAGGSITWNGMPLADEPGDFRPALRYLGHHDAIKSVLTPREMLCFWTGQWETGQWETGKAMVDARIEAALARLGLTAVAGWPGRLLSSGQRRRLALARLAASPGRLWLLDEPTVGLDAAGVTVLERLLAAHRANGGMVALSTHTPIALPDAETVDMATVAVPPEAAFFAAAMMPGDGGMADGGMADGGMADGGMAGGDPGAAA